jgi:hypothetical protein
VEGAGAAWSTGETSFGSIGIRVRRCLADHWEDWGKLGIYHKPSRADVLNYFMPPKANMLSLPTLSAHGWGINKRVEIENLMVD